VPNALRLVRCLNRNEDNQIGWDDLCSEIDGNRSTIG
jgi:hypothetical protein